MSTLNKQILQMVEDINENGIHGINQEIYIKEITNNHPVGIPGNRKYFVRIGQNIQFTVERYMTEGMWSWIWHYNLSTTSAANILKELKVRHQPKQGKN